MKQFPATLLRLEKIALDYYEARFTWPRDLRVPLPGQILSLRIEDSTAPLLRRPFALSSFDKEKLEAGIIFQKRGHGTELLAAHKPGEILDVLGPRGFGFTPPKPGSRPILVAGGVGTGPLVFLANYLAAKGFKPLIVLGFRNHSFVPELEFTAEVEVVYTTDDGSFGYRGNPLMYLRDNPPLGDAAYYACGPHVLLEATHVLALETNSPCQVSLEEVMACMVGACMGCTCETNDHRKIVRVCTEGPVFDSRVVKWN
ncbi:MAG: hypothetical protein A2Z96_05460 [Spirochaetes bacterium GWB1_48_6]|nr:MAG: hypothetical protein A2Z96_05460 [Spirochaetes bacterium GWB1_48_6]